jgi:hypothetical protein
MRLDFFIFYFIYIYNFIKKRKAPLSTQEVYTGAAKTAHKKKETQQTLNNQKPSNPNPQEALPSIACDPCLSYAERTRLHHRN